MMESRDGPVAGGGARSAPFRIITAAIGSESQAENALKALAEAGWVVVPKLPNDAMLEAAYWSAHEENAAGVWEEMITASTR